MDRTSISWCDATWSVVTGCTPISEGCRHCYAARYAKRGIGDFRGEPIGRPALDENGDMIIPRYGKIPFSKVRTHFDRLEVPLHWKRPRRIFTVSMGDLFHEEVPMDFIRLVFAVAMACPQHTFQILTKRERIMQDFFQYYSPDDCYVESQFINESRGANNPSMLQAKLRCMEGLADHDHSSVPKSWPLKNVWLGVTAEDQSTADERISILLKTPAYVRFASLEPLLGPIDLNKREFLIDKTRFHLTLGRYLDWVIVGGETGPGARLVHPDWVRGIRDQCLESNVPFHFKQWGEWIPDGQMYHGGREDDFKCERNALGHTHFTRVGKKYAGRMIDGKEYLQFPREVAA